MTKKGSEKSLAVPRQPLGGAQRAPPSRKAGPLVRYAQSPAQGARPLGTPIMWSKGPKAKKCRSAAFFLTLLYPSPIDPSGAKMVGRGMAPLRGELSPKVTEGWLDADFCFQGHPSPAARELPSRGANGAQPYGCCRGEHCSPAEFCVVTKLHGRTLFAPTPPYMWGCRGRRPRRPGQFHGTAPMARRGRAPSLQTNINVTGSSPKSRPAL